MKFEKIVITGGSRGIGKALVDLFLKDNCEIHVIARNFRDQPQVSNLIFHSLDLTETDKVSEFIEIFIKKYGVPDLVINNAGSGAFFEWNSFPEAEIYKQINLLFVVPILFCRIMAPAMAKRNGGMIVNISSLATLYPVPCMPLYNACKSALSSFTQSMMLEYNNPKFLDVILGDVRTEFNDVVAKGKIDFFSSKTKNAWKQVEVQLNCSPGADQIAQDIKSKIQRGKSSKIYGGGFLHKRIFPWLYRLIPSDLLIKMLQKYYGI